MVGNTPIASTRTLKYLGVVFTENYEFRGHVEYAIGKMARVFGAYAGILRGKEGLSNEVRLLIYRQIIRPLISYSFPVWFGISSSQMERLRKWERRIIAPCVGLRRTRDEYGIWKRPSNKSIYNAIDFERIDAFLVKGALAFLRKCGDLDNMLISRSLEYSEGIEDLTTAKYLPPVSLLTLEREGFMFTEGKLLFYHRRYGTMDLLNTAYNTAQ